MQRTHSSGRESVTHIVVVTLTTESLPLRDRNCTRERFINAMIESKENQLNAINLMAMRDADCVDHFAAACHAHEPMTNQICPSVTWRASLAFVFRP